MKKKTRKFIPGLGYIELQERAHRVFICHSSNDRHASTLQRLEVLPQLLKG